MPSPSILIGALPSIKITLAGQELKD